METLELERNAIRRIIRRDQGRPIFEPTYAQRHAQASAAGNSSFLMAVAGNGRGVDNSTWHPLQNAAGQIYFMVGYDAVGDDCHPIFGG